MLQSADAINATAAAASAPSEQAALQVQQAASVLPMLHASADFANHAARLQAMDLNLNALNHTELSLGLRRPVPSSEPLPVPQQQLGFAPHGLETSLGHSGHIPTQYGAAGILLSTGYQGMPSQAGIGNASGSGGAALRSRQTWAAQARKQDPNRKRMEAKGARFRRYQKASAARGESPLGKAEWATQVDAGNRPADVDLVDFC